jgi:hypothetical protein
MKKQIDKFDMVFVYLFLVFPIILFTPLFGLLFKFLMKDYPWLLSGGFFDMLLPFGETTLEGAIFSFLFFVTLSLFVFEVERKYLISGIILGLIFLFWFVARLDYIYLLWDFSGPLTAFVIAKTFLLIKNKYAEEG